MFPIVSSLMFIWYMIWFSYDVIIFCDRFYGLVRPGLSLLDFGSPRDKGNIFISICKTFNVRLLVEESKGEVRTGLVWSCLIPASLAPFCLTLQPLLSLSRFPSFPHLHSPHFPPSQSSASPPYRQNRGILILASYAKKIYHSTHIPEHLFFLAKFD